MTHSANAAGNWSAPTITFETPRTERVKHTWRSVVHLDVLLPVFAACIVVLILLAWAP